MGDEGMALLVQKMREIAPRSTKRGAAKELGVTEDWVKHHARKHGIRFRGRADVYGQADIRKFREAVAQEGSIRGAAKRLGMGYVQLKEALRRARARDVRPREKVDTDYLQRLRRAAFLHAIKNGASEQDAEDFGSYAVIQALTHDTPVTFKFTFLNWNHEQHGSTQSGTGRSRRMETLHAESVCPTGQGMDDNGERTGVVPAVEPSDVVRNALDHISVEAPGLLVEARLMILFGFTAREIAVALNVREEVAEARCTRIREILIPEASASQP